VAQEIPLTPRPSCAGRSPWYDLTGRKPGIGFWPMAEQYRHIIPANPSQFACNHNLFDVHSLMADDFATRALMPILNSSLVGLIKLFFGRYAGTEGNLKTEIVDVVMIEIPDPRNVTPDILKRLESGFVKMQGRTIGRLVEQEFMDCHTKDEVREGFYPRYIQMMPPRQCHASSIFSMPDIRRRYGNNYRWRYSPSLRSNLFLLLIKRARYPAVEIMMASSAIRNLIRTGQDHQIRSHISTGRVEGMMTMEQSLAELVRSGRILREVALAHCYRPEDLHQYLNGILREA
jgi:hypothetical protein